MAIKYPQIKQLFDANSLSVFVVQTDDLELIEEMFSRLNEAVPLNAAEKRNAFGGPLPKIVRNISAKEFFAKRLKISNKRYQHRDLAAKYVYLTYNKKVLDTKKVYLDAFFINNKSNTEAKFRAAVKVVDVVLSTMNGVFTVSDKLLGSSGMAVLYYLLFERAVKEKWNSKPTRSALVRFEEARAKNREKAAKDIANADYDLLEFDRLSQTPNDAYAIKFRLELLARHVRKKGT